MTAAPAAAFRRTKLTWQAYLLMAYYSYLVNCLGPLAPFLRDELGLSYTVASLHLSGYALGTVLSGLLLTGPAIRRFGAYRVIWGGGLGMAAGALLVMFGRAAAVTILGALLMGLLGVVIVAIFQGALSMQHGEQRSIALTESMVASSLLAGLSPVAVGFFARTALTWRAALGVSIFFLAGLWLAYRRSAVPRIETAGGEGKTPGGEKAPLPALFWLYWTAAALSVSIEFCIILWGTDYLQKVGGLARPNAALGMSLFMGAMLAGRMINSRLVWNSLPASLVKASLVVTAAGFALFWLGPMLAPALAGPGALAGLVVSGLGISGLFPLLASQALGACPGQTVEGSATFTLASGSAILALPLLLGRLADWSGIRAAYGLVVALVALDFLVNWGAQRVLYRARLREIEESSLDGR
jgi:MFS family permease